MVAKDKHMGNITRNFSTREFACKCGDCDLDGTQIDKGLVYKLQVIRERIAKRIIINSACRCGRHNDDVGGSLLSYHLRSMAVDVRCDNSLDRHELVKHSLNQGLTVGISDNFIHIDCRDIPIIFLY